MADLPGPLVVALQDRYRLERELGAGGMATVYLAEDLKHRRRVAVKVLRPELAATMGAERFAREIDVAARLQHPHILGLLDSGDADGFFYYVMPFVEGETLRDRLARAGELPVHEAVRLMGEIADALAVAHRAGVVHRDIKPENVLLSGRHAMVMDFGVAKAVSEASGRQQLTTGGVALGTPAYMAPEQATADPHLDGRVDIYALGVLGYEMLTGQPPFYGLSPQQTLAAHVTQAPVPVGQRRPGLSPALESVVMRCLEKRPADRYQTADELMIALEPLATPSGGTTPDATSPVGVRPWSRWRRREIGMAMAAGVAVITMIAVLAGRIMGPSNAGAVAPTQQQLTFNGKVTLSAISPDGKFLAYTTEWYWYSDTTPRRLFVQDLGGGPALEIAKLEQPISLGWSPDGAGVLVGGAYQRKWGLFLFPRLGGTPQLLSTAAYAAMSPDGARIASTFQDPRRIDIRDLRSGDTSSMRIPGSFKWITAVAWSPRGKILAVLTSPGDGNPSLWTLSVSGRDTTLVVQPAEGKIDSWAWASSGDAIYYVTKDELWRVPVSATTGQRIGPSRRLLSNTPIAEDGRNYISLTTSGLRLAYSKLQLQANVWVGAAAATLGPAKSTAMRQLTTGTTVKRCVAVSPDLQRIAFIQLGSDGGRDIYSALVASGTIDRVTFTGTVSGSSCPVWSPSGLSIAFLATVAGERRVAVVSASAGGAPQIFAKKTDHIYTWLQNGRIVYQMPGYRNVGLFDPKTGVDQPLVANDSVGWLFNPVFSPDGKRVVVYWNRSEAGGLWLVSLVDRSQRLLPHDPSSALGVLGWTRDGNALLIRGADRFVRRIPLTGGAGTVVATVPPISSCELIEPPQRLTLVCMIVDPTEDVWMVENFDPAVRASKK